MFSRRIYFICIESKNSQIYISSSSIAASAFDKHHKYITVDPDERRGNAFDYGSGFVNPTKVLDPGLVYDAKPADYREFLCSIGYDKRSLHLITGDNSTCDDRSLAPLPSDLNYPSIVVSSLNDNSFSVTRTLTNVGRPRSIYRAAVSAPRGINVTVVPRRIAFHSYGQRINFTVNFKVAAAPPSKGYVFGSLSWRNKKSWVTSPLVVRVMHSKLGMTI